MEDIRHVLEGMGALGLAWAAHAWALMYPFVTGTTALLGMIYMVHAVSRIAWRWWHGYPNFLTTQEIEKSDDGEC